MATFSYEFPRAVHVLPLQALRGILEERALLAKKDLVRRVTAAVRATTSLTDAALGLSDYVHFYLLGDGASWESVPILATQLLPGREAPFPHVALETPTSSLEDDDCTLCLWNIAVSRPGVPGVCQGGNWTRGTNPNRIAEVWRAFRNSTPTPERARGYWNDPIQVPTLRGSQIERGLCLLGRAASGMPELLLRAPVQVDGRFTLWVFSDDDMASVTALQHALGGVQVRHYAMRGYESTDLTTRTWRSRIDSYFTRRAPFPATLDFDRRR
jgi:hypothetical protein